MSNRESMVFYRSWWLAVEELPEDIRQEVISATIEYGFIGSIPDSMSNIARAMFALIKPQIDINNAKWENGCRGREFGALGGRPKNPKETPNITPKVTPKKNQENPKGNPKKTPNVNDNVNDNDNPLSLSPSQDPKEGGVTATERDRFFEIFYYRNAKQPNEEVERFINHYEASGWCRNGSSRPVRNKYALAKSWKFEDATPRYDTCTMNVLTKFESACIEIGDAWITKELNAYLVGVDEYNGKMRILLTDKVAIDAIEAHKHIIAKHLQCEWSYGVKRA
ncbi:MAG: DUF6291 domain-containing protein [Alistipes sp.]|nr:DUF6291 domain-containing protein [Alistipes sp.]